MARLASRITIRLALNPTSWRADDKARWANSLAGAVDAAAPHLMSIEGYEIRDTLVYIRLRSPEEPRRLKKRVRDDEAFRRLRVRLSDMDARPEFEIEPDKEIQP